MLPVDSVPSSSQCPIKRLVLRALRLGPIHKSHPIILSSIWSAASDNLQYPRTPIFDAHVSSIQLYRHQKLFLSSLCFGRLPQMQGFASARSGILHFTLRSRQNYLFIVISLEKEKENWPCCIAIDRTLCHSHHSHRLAFMIIGMCCAAALWLR